MTTRSQDSRRISTLLADRRVSGVAMLAVLTAGLLFGLVGFAFHTLWIVSIIVLALGLGYVVANVRTDRREVVERDQASGQSAR
jgi:general stress protein CsbA